MRIAIVLIVMWFGAGMALADDTTPTASPASKGAETRSVARTDMLVISLHDTLAAMAKMLGQCEGVKGDIAAMTKLQAMSAPMILGDVSEVIDMAAQLKRTQTSMADLLGIMRNCSGIMDVRTKEQMVERLAAEIRQIRYGGDLEEDQAFSGVPMQLRRNCWDLSQTDQLQKKMLQILDDMELLTTVKNSQAARDQLAALRAQMRKMNTDANLMLEKCSRDLAAAKAALPKEAEPPPPPAQ